MSATQIKKQSEILTCNVCHKYFKDPVILSCGESMCKEHIEIIAKNEKSANNIYKCLVCDEDHEMAKTGFQQSVALINLLKLNIHLDEKKQEEFGLIDALHEIIEEMESLCSESNDFVIMHVENLRNMIEIKKNMFIEKIAVAYQEMLIQLNIFENDCLRSSIDLSNQKELNEIGNKIEYWKETLRTPKLSQKIVDELINETHTYLDKLQQNIKTKTINQSRILDEKNFYFDSSSKLEFSNSHDLGELVFDEFKGLASFENNNKSWSKLEELRSLNDKDKETRNCFTNENVNEIRKLIGARRQKLDEKLVSISNEIDLIEMFKVELDDFENDFEESLNKSKSEESQRKDANQEYDQENFDFDDDEMFLNLTHSKMLSFPQPIELINLCEFGLNTEFKLRYRATRDGFKASDFHSKCDSISKTLTLIKVKDNPHIFGGYTEASWGGSYSCWRSDNNAFLFSLVNSEKRPVKLKVKLNDRNAISANPDYGVIFGYAGDLNIVSESNLKKESYSNLGSSYPHPFHQIGTDQAENFLAGSFKFMTSEIELYEVINEPPFNINDLDYSMTSYDENKTAYLLKLLDTNINQITEGLVNCKIKESESSSITMSESQEWDSWKLKRN